MQPTEQQIREAVWRKRISLIAMGLEPDSYAEKPPFRPTVTAMAVYVVCALAGGAR